MVSEAETKVPLSLNEADRLEALGHYEILDTMPEREFDDLAFLAAQICQAPVALITFIDQRRQWFKARVGVDMVETPRDLSFCAHAITQAEPLTVADLRQDPRFAANPFVVGEPHVRFYSGAPLVTPDGHALGTLCVLDVVPRQLTTDQQEALSRLSRQVVAQLELRRSLKRLQRTVSERDNALASGHHSERLRRAIVDNASDGIITLDEQGRIQSCNAAASQLFGAACDVLIGRPVQQWIVELGSSAGANDVLEFLREGRAPDRAEPRISAQEINAQDVGWLVQSGAFPSIDAAGEARREAVAEAENGEKLPSLIRELTLRRRDGEDVQMESSIGEIEFEGQLLFIALLRDISERRRTERLKTEFISTVSHELRTPLTSIHGSLSLLRGGVSEPQASATVPSQAVRSQYEMPEGARMLLDIACNNSERLVRLINDILDISKIEAGRMEFNLRPLDLKAFLSKAIDANRAYGEGFGVRFELQEVPADIKVQADGDRLMQVMTNLLSNAAKFTQHSDIVTLAVTRHTRRHGEASGHSGSSQSAVKFARVAVTDHGPGIREEFHDRVFQKFAQADSSNTRQKGGTGLGLSISKAIIERMGGHIGFTTRTANASPAPVEENAEPEALETSRTDSGTTFFFDLPEWVLPEQALPEQALPEQALPEQALPEQALPEQALRSPHPQSESSGLQSTAQSTAQSTLMPSGTPQSFARFAKGTMPTDKTGNEALGSEQSTLAAAETVDEVGNAPKSLGKSDAASPQAAEHPRILICEDDADVASVLAMMLQAEGFETETVPDGASARARLSEQSYDAMTLDLGLPDGDGIALIRKLRVRDDTRDMPIVVVSANADKGRPKNLSGEVSLHSNADSTSTREAGHALQIGGDALGVVDWLDKPIDQQRLRAAVVRAVEDTHHTRSRRPKPLILHVEDDPDIIQLLSLLLSDVAHMRYAMSLQDARRLLGEEAFDLVILDLTLPDGSGLDLLPLLHRGNAEATHTPTPSGASTQSTLCASDDTVSAEFVAGGPIPVVIFSASEIDNDTAQRVASVLTKSRHSHRDLLDIIRDLVPRRGGGQGSGSGDRNSEGSSSQPKYFDAQ